MRRPRSLTPLLIVLLPVLLVAGLWLGGHPQYLPGVVRDVVIGDSEAQLYEEAVDTLAETIHAFPSTSRIFNGLFADARRELARPGSVVKSG